MADPWGAERAQVVRLLAGAVAGVAVAAVAVQLWDVAGPLPTVGGLGDGTLLRPELYCCGMVSWQLQVGELLAVSAVTAGIIAGLRRLPVLRTTEASALLALGVVAASAWIVLDAILLPLEETPDAVLADHPGIAAWWAVGLALPLLAAFVPPSGPPTAPEPGDG